MQNITAKPESLRRAVAQAVVTVGNSKTIEAVANKTVPKGDVFAMAKTAGLFAVKRTSDMIPDCHPIPIEYAEIRFNVDALSIWIEVEVSTIYKTGVEVEAMHGASVVALTVYDMLKPLDNEIEIRTIRLLKKSGGKSDIKNMFLPDLKAGVLVVSDSVSKGEATDGSGIILEQRLKQYCGKGVATKLVPDEPRQIVSALDLLISEGAKLIITTGGTGLSSKDNTPEAITPLLDRTIPGIPEMLRVYGQIRTPFSMLSRGVAGLYRGSLVITLPGAPSAVQESLEVLFPAVLHYFQIADGGRHAQITSVVRDGNR